MAFASVFAVTLVPALMVMFPGQDSVGGTEPHQSRLHRGIPPDVARPSAGQVGGYRGRRRHHRCDRVPVLAPGSEFMPPLYEEDLLYMPITVPGISVAEAKRLLTWQNQQMQKVPEVERVFGKTGRARRR